MQSVLSVGEGTEYVAEPVGEPPAGTILLVRGAAHVHSLFKKKQPTLPVGLAVAALFAVVWTCVWARALPERTARAVAKREKRMMAECLMKVVDRIRGEGPSAASRYLYLHPAIQRQSGHYAMKKFSRAAHQWNHEMSPQPSTVMTTLGDIDTIQ